MIVLNLAAFGIGMSDGRSVSTQITMGGGAEERSNVSRLAPGAPPLRG